MDKLTKLLGTAVVLMALGFTLPINNDNTSVEKEKQEQSTPLENPINIENSTLPITATPPPAISCFMP